MSFCWAVFAICAHAFVLCLFFFFNDTATTEIYTLSLHDALPISSRLCRCPCCVLDDCQVFRRSEEHTSELQSRFGISYAVFCLKKKIQHSLRHQARSPGRRSHRLALAYPH